MSKWRPRGWDKIKKKNCAESLICKVAYCKTCPTNPMECDIKGEKLVSATLEALKKEPRAFCHEGMWTIFIPDVEV